MPSPTISGSVMRAHEQSPEGNPSEKTDLAARIATSTSLSKADADTAVRAVCWTITDAFARGETVRIARFYSFAPRLHPAPRGRNPRTDERVDFAASSTSSFKAGKTLRHAVA